MFAFASLELSLNSIPYLLPLALVLVFLKYANAVLPANADCTVIAPTESMTTLSSPPPVFIQTFPPELLFCMSKFPSPQ